MWGGGGYALCLLLLLLVPLMLLVPCTGRKLPLQGIQLALEQVLVPFGDPTRHHCHCCPPPPPPHVMAPAPFTGFPTPVGPWCAGRTAAFAPIE